GRPRHDPPPAHRLAARPARRRLAPGVPRGGLLAVLGAPAARGGARCAHGGTAGAARGQAPRQAKEAAVSTSDIPRPMRAMLFFFGALRQLEEWGLVRRVMPLE